MNLFKKLNDNEQYMLKDIGLNIENRDYSAEELGKYETSIEEFIMSHSSKNGDIEKVRQQYDSILKTIVKYQQ